MLSKMLDVLISNKEMFISGTITTLKISIVGTIIGLIIGLLIGIIKTIPRQKGIKSIIQKIINFLIGAYILVFRGTPMMVQAMVIYYGAPILFGLDIPSIPAAFFIVSINTGAYMAEVVRGGILAIDDGQLEAATASGFSHFQAMRYIILPQAIRNILPATGNEFIINIKDTCVLNVISVSELFFATKSIAGTNFDFFTPFAITSIIYLLLTSVITIILRFIENYMSGSKNYEVNIVSNQMQV
ncbi:MAG: amino acid ABC transporter permease [Peptoniphilaceae bacterium]